MDFESILYRITVLQNKHGFTDRSLSLAAGMSEDGVRNWRRRLERGDRVSVSLSHIISVANVLNVPLEFLTDGRNEKSKPYGYIDVLGLVGTGGSIVKHDPKRGDEIRRIARPSTIGHDDLRAIQVDGTHLAPMFQHGDVLIYEAHDDSSVPSFALDRICVCADHQGKEWIKIVHTGTQPGKFHLVSINTLSGNQLDVDLAWASPIISHQSQDLLIWND